MGSIVLAIKTKAFEYVKGLNYKTVLKESYLSYIVFSTMISLIICLSPIPLWLGIPLLLTVLVLFALALFFSFTVRTIGALCSAELLSPAGQTLILAFLIAVLLGGPARFAMQNFDAIKLQFICLKGSSHLAGKLVINETKRVIHVWILSLICPQPPPPSLEHMAWLPRSMENLTFDLVFFFFDSLEVASFHVVNSAEQLDKIKLF